MGGWRAVTADPERFCADCAEWPCAPWCGEVAALLAELMVSPVYVVDASGAVRVVTGEDQNAA